MDRFLDVAENDSQSEQSDQSNGIIGCCLNDRNFSMLPAIQRDRDFRALPQNSFAAVCAPFAQCTSARLRGTDFCQSGVNGNIGRPRGGSCPPRLGAVRPGWALYGAQPGRLPRGPGRLPYVPGRLPEIGRGRCNTFPTGQIQRFRFPSSRSGPAGGDVQVIGTVSAHPRVSPPPSPPDPSRLGPPGRGTKTGGWERPPG